MVRLRELRDEFDLKIRSFEEFGFSRGIINNIELQVSNPDNEKIEIFCNIFDVSSDYFLGLSDEGIYAYYNDIKYSLDRNDFFDYKKLDYIKYDGRKRLLVVPDRKEVITKLSSIPAIKIIDKE